MRKSSAQALDVGKSGSKPSKRESDCRNVQGALTPKVPLSEYPPFLQSTPKTWQGPTAATENFT